MPRKTRSFTFKDLTEHPHDWVVPRADWATHTGATKPAITIGVLREILLVVLLGVMECAEVLNFGRDWPEAVGPKNRLITFTAFNSSLMLRIVRRQNDASILTSDVVSLPHALGWVV